LQFFFSFEHAPQIQWLKLLYIAKSVKVMSADDFELPPIPRGERQIKGGASTYTAANYQIYSAPKLGVSRSLVLHFYNLFCQLFP